MYNLIWKTARTWKNSKWKTFSQSRQKTHTNQIFKIQAINYPILPTTLIIWLLIITYKLTHTIITHHIIITIIINISLHRISKTIIKILDTTHLTIKFKKRISYLIITIYQINSRITSKTLGKQPRRKVTISKMTCHWRVKCISGLDH